MDFCALFSQTNIYLSGIIFPRNLVVGFREIAIFRTSKTSYKKLGEIENQKRKPEKMQTSWEEFSLGRLLRGRSSPYSPESSTSNLTFFRQLVSEFINWTMKPRFTEDESNNNLKFQNQKLLQHCGNGGRFG